MKFLPFAIALLLAGPTDAMAQDLSGTWQWIEVDAAHEWGVEQGLADVTFSGGRIVAHLRDGKYPNVVDFELTGILTKTGAGPRPDAAAHGNISAKVTRVASDMAAGDPYRGTYIRLDNPPLFQKSVGRSSEYISLTDGFNFLGLKRDIH